MQNGKRELKISRKFVYYRQLLEIGKAKESRKIKGFRV